LRCQSSGQIPQTDPLGLLTGHGLGCNQHIQPETLGHGGQAGRHLFRIHFGILAGKREFAAQGPQRVAVFPITIRAEFAIGGSGLGFAPERKPHGELVALAHGPVEIHFHHGPQLIGGGGARLLQALLPGALVFIGQVAQRFHEQALLALKVQVDDALAQARFPGHRGGGGVGQATLGDAANGGLDQLQPPRLGRGGAFSR
jgi:hypothetical protein